MKLWIIRWIMVFAWTCDEYADAFVEWAQQQYSNEVHGIGSIEP